MALQQKPFSVLAQYRKENTSFVYRSFHKRKFRKFKRPHHFKKKSRLFVVIKGVKKRKWFPPKIWRRMQARKRMVPKALWIRYLASTRFKIPKRSWFWRRKFLRRKWKGIKAHIRFIRYSLRFKTAIGRAGIYRFPSPVSLHLSVSKNIRRRSYALAHKIISQKKTFKYAISLLFKQRRVRSIKYIYLLWNTHRKPVSSHNFSTKLSKQFKRVLTYYILRRSIHNLKKRKKRIRTLRCFFEQYLSSTKQKYLHKPSKIKPKSLLANKQMYILRWLKATYTKKYKRFYYTNSIAHTISALTNITAWLGNFHIVTSPRKSLPHLFIFSRHAVQVSVKKNQLYITHNNPSTVLIINFNVYGSIFVNVYNRSYTTLYLHSLFLWNTTNTASHFTKYPTTQNNDMLHFFVHASSLLNTHHQLHPTRKFVKKLPVQTNYLETQQSRYSFLRNLKGLRIYQTSKKLYRFKLFRKFFRRSFHRYRRIRKHKLFISLFRAYFKHYTSYNEKEMMDLWLNFRRGTNKYWSQVSLVQRFSQSILLIPQHIALILNLAPSLSAARALAQAGGLLINGSSSANLLHFLRPGDMFQFLPKLWLLAKQLLPFQSWKYLRFKANYLRFFQVDWSMLLFVFIRWPYAFELKAPKFLSERWIRFYIRQFPVHSRKYYKVKMTWKYYPNTRRTRRWF